MTDGFVRKKVESLTLGEKLRKLRGEYRMTLAEVSKATKIQVKYLEWLENGEYEKLPADVYVRGFLRGYARHLSLEEETFLKLYEKECNIQANLGHQQIFDVRPRAPLMSSFVLTSRTVILTGIILTVAGTFTYLFYEFRSFVAEPQLLVTEPVMGAIIEGSVVSVKGKTDRGAQVTVNDQAVFVGSEGDFRENIVLQTGLNTITVRAVNRFDKVQEETINFEARFETPLPAVAEEARERFLVVVVGKEKGAQVVIEADGLVVFSGELLNEARQEVTAEKSVKLSTNNGKNTLVSFRGGASEPLSEKAVALKGVLYTSEGRQETSESKPN